MPLRVLAALYDIVNVLRPATRSPHWRWLRLFVLVMVDALILSASYFIAYQLRFDFEWPADFRDVFLGTWPLVLATGLPIFVIVGMYRQVWRYADLRGGLLIIKSVIIATLVFLALCLVLSNVSRMPPRSVFGIHATLAILLLGTCRFSWRILKAGGRQPAADQLERCLVYGASSDGDLLVRHIAASPRCGFKAVAFIDDDRNKVGGTFHGLRVAGTCKDLAEIARRFEAKTVILAMPRAPGQAISKAVTHCQEVGLKTLIMPDMTSALGNEVFRPREIDITDLLRRAPLSVDHDKIKGFFSGKTVLITGAGGSIGSELARQVASYGPARIVLLDASEFNLYKIETELCDRRLYGTVIEAALGSTIDRRFLERIFDEFRPNIVLHAAAYKHVPILQKNPLSGIINNVFGTLVLAKLAQAQGVERFLLISTDKAVRPTSIMGATKRCCELIVQALQQQAPDDCGFCSVRFGNVLGSSGSVVPRFTEQIRAGGPVTVTHPDVTRYFMLTSEAVGLVLQSIATSRGGEIFVLNMGEPVRIFDMAERLIRLSGKEPGRDIEIVFSGLRPGEKLHEELILDTAEHQVLNDDVFVATPFRIAPRAVLDRIEDLIARAFADDDRGAIEILWRLSDMVEPGKRSATVVAESDLPLH